jgi:predicted NBD/HSP70 family sugar kinase
MSQSQVVQVTGLKAPTVFRIFAKLEEESYIRLCEAPDGGSEANARERKGRKPAYYCVVPDAAFAVGVDFSTSGVSVIVVNFVNDVIYHENQEFAEGVRRDEILSRIGDMISAALDACGLKSQALAGIGIGAPGIVDTQSGVVVQYSRIPGLTNFSLKDYFQKTFDAPVFVHNNASVIAASEYHYASAKEYRSVLAVLVRGGVGGAFVNHGQIFVNGTTTALELGRTSVCVTDAEQISSDPRTLESVVGEQPLLTRLAQVENVRDWHQVQAELSETRIAEILAEPVNMLATAVRNLYHILHPDAVLLISRYEKLAQVLARAVAGAVPESISIPITYDPVKACYGATDLVFQHFFADSASTGNRQTISG